MRHGLPIHLRRGAGCVLRPDVRHRLPVPVQPLLGSGHERRRLVRGRGGLLRIRPLERTLQRAHAGLARSWSATGW